MTSLTPQLKSTDSLPQAPRQIAPARSFEALVDWCCRLIAEKNCPGLIVGISGTDSILSFMIAATAFQRLGRGDRVVGMHYGAAFPPEGKTAAEIDKIVDMNPSYRWVARVIVPWLQKAMPQAQVMTDSGIDHTDDYQRWAALFRASLNGAMRTEPLADGQNYWVMGTQNATERALGTYSNMSSAASLQPLAHLWKSEILKICQWLDVPQLAIDKSRQVDCDCGRFDLAADHIEEVDAILMARAGQLSPAYLAAHIAPELLARLQAFVDEQLGYGGFKKQIPYIPDADLVGG